MLLVGEKCELVFLGLLLASARLLHGHDHTEVLRVQMLAEASEAGGAPAQTGGRRRPAAACAAAGGAERETGACGFSGAHGDRVLVVEQPPPPQHPRRRHSAEHHHGRNNSAGECPCAARASSGFGSCHMNAVLRSGDELRVLSYCSGGKDRSAKMLVVHALNREQRRAPHVACMCGRGRMVVPAVHLQFALGARQA